MGRETWIINLERRPDRLETLLDQIDGVDWPFDYPQVFRAIDGNRTGCPPDFTQGGGAFGCKLSHVMILADCLNRGVEEALILEDDATLLPSFRAKYDAFMEAVPADWNGIMLGGQHHSPPMETCPGVVQVRYAQRTHAYVARRPYMKALLHRWHNATVHIDWLMKDWHHRQGVYAPERWLIGQARSESNINGRTNPAFSWNSPTGKEPVIVLRSSREVAEALGKKGCHIGYDRNADGIDVGVARTLKGASSVSALSTVIYGLVSEAISEPNLTATLWHPTEATKLRAMARMAWKGPIRFIDAGSVEEAEAQLGPANSQRADLCPA